MFRLSQLSLKTRFILSVSTITTCALLFALGLVAYHNFHTYKKDLQENAEMMAEILASNIAPALLFEDKGTAREAFVILDGNPHITAAIAYDIHQQVIAEYPANNSANVAHKFIFHEGTQFSTHYLDTYRRVTLSNEEVGYIWLRFKLDILYERFKQYTYVFAMTFILAILLTLFLISMLKRLLEKPVLQLMATAQQVTQERNYRKRIIHDRKDEVGTLLDAFNNMMNVIEDRDKQLLEHSEKLEQIIELRTQQINHRANFDALTDLPNRYLLMDRVRQSIRSIRRHGGKLAVLYLDLDRFKIVNDNLGHMVGDKLLIAVSKRLVKALREEDTVSRLGGDEFLILMEGIENSEDVENIAKIIIKSLQKPFEIMDHTLHVSTSIGIALYPDDGDDENAIMQHADVSMYQAKKSGRGQYISYKPVFEIDSRHRLCMEIDLRKAINNEELMMVFQPIHNSTTGKLSGFESLLRWNRNGVEVNTPDQFLPVAEEIGLMKKLENWVIQYVCIFIQNLDQHMIKDLRFSINLSPGSLRDPKFVKKMVETVARHHINPSLLEIEITEDTFLEATEAVYDRLNSLKEYGMSIAIDDFGTGYSSLSYLRNYPVNTLKIDGCFINDLETNNSSQGIISSTISLGHSLGMKMIAECVETRGQSDFLKIHQCDLVQGHFYSRPLLPDEAMDYIHSCHLSLSRQWKSDTYTL